MRSFRFHVFLLAFFLLQLNVYESLAEQQIKCLSGVSLDPSKSPESPSSTHATCCVAFDFKDNKFTYDNGQKYNNKNECFLFGTPPDQNQFVCCCNNEHYCNSYNFVQYYFSNYIITHSLKSTFTNYLPLIVFVLVSLVLVVITYMALDYCVIQQRKGQFKTEMPPDYYSNLRGTKVLPYLTKGEAKMVIKQIKTARSTEPPEIKTIKKKTRIIGVYTYSTTATVTNRELGAVTLGQPKDDPFLSTLIRMIKIGPREVRFDGNHLLDIIDKAESIFKSEPSLLDVPVPVQIYGDLHGQYSDLLRWLHVNGWPPATRCCFLGDYVDRGRHSIEVIVMLFLLKIVMPYDVYICRGNHEDYNINKVYSFYAELEARLDRTNRLHDRVFNRFMQCFTCIPLAARIGNRALGMHGGLSPRLESWDDILCIQRPVNFKPGTLACDLAWSDPNRASTEFEVNYKRDRKNGIGYLFGVRQVQDTCQMLDIDLVIRGHQAPMPGYEMFGENLITVFSAPGYRTSSELETNFGASINLNEDGSMIITRIGVDNHVRLLRDLQKLDKNEPYTDMDKLALKPKREDDDGTF